MNHFRARRLLAALPDGTLPAQAQAKVSAHAAGCERCRRLLAEYESMNRLLRSLPAALVPPSPSPEAEGALDLLARWVGPARVPWFERLPIHPIGALATALALFLGVFLLTPPFEIQTAEPFNVVVVASAQPGRPERPRRLAIPMDPAFRDHTAENFLIPVAMR
jgi:anti-sigma factor RsiW